MNQTMSMRILVVDDEEFVRDTLIDLLGFLGHDAMAAKDGHSGLRALEENHFDAAISDLRMPGLDGIGFLREAKKLNPDLPILIISGHGIDDAAEKAIKTGAVGLLGKPFRLEDLKDCLAVITRILGKEDAPPGS